MTILGMIIGAFGIIFIGMIIGGILAKNFCQRTVEKVIYKNDRDGLEMERLENTISDLRQARLDDLCLIKETSLLNIGLKEHINNITRDRILREASG